MAPNWVKREVWYLSDTTLELHREFRTLGGANGGPRWGDLWFCVDSSDVHIALSQPAPLRLAKAEAQRISEARKRAEVRQAQRRIDWADRRAAHIYELVREQIDDHTVVEAIATSLRKARETESSAEPDFDPLW